MVGEEGSGKSTLLQALLGELQLALESEGETLLDPVLEIPRKTAYHSQVLLMVQDSLRENVTFHSPFDLERYKQAIFAASLRADLDILPGGDEAPPLGPRGIQLSGGQKARVSLARAAYCRDAHVVLMDVPLASVDAPTGRHLFEHLICSQLMKGRTRIVVCQPTRHRLSKFSTGTSSCHGAAWWWTDCQERSCRPRPSRPYCAASRQRRR